MAENFGLSAAEIQNRIPLLRLPEKRFQFVEKKGILFVNDSYNANSASTIAALQSLPAPKSGGKKVAVLGSMLELGQFSEQCHAEVAQVALEAVAELLCLGEECVPMVHVWSGVRRKAHLFDSHASLLLALRARLKPGDVVLIKGSRSKQMWKVLEEF